MLRECRGIWLARRLLPVTTLTIRPARYLPMILYGGLFVICVYILVTAQSAGAYVLGSVGSLAGAVALIHFLLYYRIEFRDGVLHQYRFFGLGDRLVPLASLTGVDMEIRKNFLMMGVPRVCIRWPQDAICLTSSVYRESDLRLALRCISDAGVVVPVEILRRFKVHVAG